MKYKFLLTNFLVILFFSCVKQSLNNNFSVVFPEIKNEAKEQLDKIFFYYKNYNRDTFANLISEKYLQDKVLLLNKIEECLSKNQILDVQYTIDQIFLLDNKMVVNIKWHIKKVLRKTSQQKILKGRTQLVFVKENNVWLLENLRGENLFY